MGLIDGSFMWHLNYMSANVLVFMGNHPFLTFFLAAILAEMIVKVVQAICGR
jgi:hypothetical protein